MPPAPTVFNHRVIDVGIIQQEHIGNSSSNQVENENVSCD